MHPRVESFPAPQPNYRHFLAAVSREIPVTVPLIELAVATEVVAVLADRPLPAIGDSAAERAIASASVQLLHRLGYDVVKISVPVPFHVPRVRADDTASPATRDRQWQDQHSGCVHSMADLETYRWPTLRDISFAAVDAAVEVLPDGMALVAFSGGVFEYSTDILGLERFMYAVYDDPDLVAAVVEHVGRIVYDVFEACCQVDAVCALWLGDDLGSKNGLLISPDFLKTHVFPWYKRFADLAHRNNLPFLLHSCGSMHSVMPALLDEVGIDAKHSFEDGILPVERFIDQWGSRVAALGGIDVNLLAQGPEGAIVARTLEVLEYAAPRGGYACGSGNSIPNYVPANHYLAMLETVARFNGRL